MSNIPALFNPTQLPAHIKALQQAASEIDDTDQYGYAGPRLVTLSIKGKEFRFRSGGQENATGLRELECIVVRRRETLSRRFYDAKYSSGSTAAPDCHSIDSVKPDRGNNIQAESCAACPHSAWGSKVTEDGKLGFSCDNYKMLALVPFIDGVPAEQAVQLLLPPNSFKRSKGETGNQMFSKEYFEALKHHGLPAIGAVTRLKFTSAEYPQVAFEFVRHATSEELQHAMALRDSPEVVGVITGTLVDDAREPEAIAEQPRPQIEAPKPAPKAVAAPKPVAKLADVVKQAEAAAAPKNPRIVPKVAPVQMEPVEEAEVVQAAPAADDPMAAVKALLAKLG